MSIEGMLKGVFRRICVMGWESPEELDLMGIPGGDPLRTLVERAEPGTPACMSQAKCKAVSHGSRHIPTPGKEGAEVYSD